MVSDAKHFFVYLLAIHMFSLEKCLLLLCSFLIVVVIIIIIFLLLSYMRSLYIWDINPLSDMWFANISSPSIGCLSILMPVSCAEQKLFSLVSSHLRTKNQMWPQSLWHLQSVQEDGNTNQLQQPFKILLQIVIQATCTRVREAD